MDAFIARYCLSVLLLTSTIGSTNTGSNETSSEDLRQPRVSGRIVKLYSGAKPEPYLCPGEGFQPDPKNCAVFYRCVKERSGKFTVFRYQCAPGTVYDPDVEICNHPRSTRRTECGGTKKTSPDKFYTTQANEIHVAQSEVPRPIITKEPIYTEQTTLNHLSSNTWALFTHPTTSRTRETPTVSETTKLFDLTSKYQWASSSQPVTEYVTRYTKESTTQQSKTQSGDQCTTDGFMGDSENCRKFYRCVGNQRGGFIRYEFSCTELTVWDDDIEGCNHPWAVKRSKCGRSMSYADKSATQASSTYSTETTSTKDPDTAYAGNYGEKNNKTIQKQTQISYGSKVTQTQTQISHSNDVVQNQTQIHYENNNRNDSKKSSESKQNQTQISYGSAVSQTQTQIDYGNKGVQTQLQIDHSKDSSQSQVQVQETTTGSTSTSTQKNNVNNNNGGNECTESGFMGDSNDCKKFYRCVDNGRGYTKFQYVCGEGTVWDPSIEACNHVWAVKNCGGNAPPEPTSERTTTTQTKTTESQTKPPTSSSTQSLHTTVDEDDDDNDVGYNNQPSNQGTSTSTTSTSHTTTKKPNGGTGTECTSSGFMGDENDCKVFYRCVDDGKGGFTRYEFKCGDGTLWDPEIDACNHATAVKKCGGKPGPGSTSAPTKPTEYPTESTKTTQSQPPTTQEIDENEDVGYGNQEQSPSSTTITQSSTTTTKRPSGSSTECTSSGFIGDSNDCKVFYRCVDNGNGGYTKYEFKCGDGTVWDSEIEACNHEWAVKKCGGSGSNNSENEEPTTKKEYPQNTQTTVTLTQITTQQPPSNDDYDSGYGSHNDEPLNSATTQGTTKQPMSQEQSECKSSGFMGDDNDCKKFYRCVDNGNGGFTRYEFTCGEGTVWDAKIEACNHAWAVEKCGGSNMNESPETTSSTTTQSSESTSQTTEASKETNQPTYTTTSTTSNTGTQNNKCSRSGFIGDSSDCKKFYRCVDNGDGSYTRYEFACGEGTVWDPKIEACNHAWAVENCGSQFTDVNKETTSQQPVLQDENQENGYQSPNYDDSEASETSTSSTTKTVPPKESNEMSGDECSQEGFFGNKKECKKFYRCVDNGKGGFVKYDFTCGEGTVWNQEIQACDHESADKTCSSTSSGQTSSSSTQTSSSSTQTQSETTTSVYSTTKQQQSTAESESSGNECKSEGFFAHRNDCKKFIRCVDNGNGGYTKYEFSCGDGTVWVQEIQACDHDNEVTSCKSSSGSVTQNNEGSSSSGSQQNISSSTESMPPEKEHDEYETGDSKEPSKDETVDCTSEGYFANKQDCRKFYRCVDNGNGGYTKYDFDCGEGTAWDSDIQTCNHISEVPSCTESNQQNESNGDNGSDTTTNKNDSETQGTSSTTKATPSSRDDSCESEGYFGNSNDCKKFYRCVDNGKGGYTKYDFTCGEGTIWDQDVTTCNHPGDVANPSCSSSQQSGDGSTSSIEGSSSQTTSSSSTDSSGGSSSSSQSSTSESSESSSKKPSNQNETCDEAGYYPNPNDCKKFYRCVDWDGDGKKFSVFHFECGEGTIWDPALDTCNYEESVYPPRDCSQSQSQSMGSETTTEGKEDTTTESTMTTEQTTTQESTTEQSTTESTTTEQTTTSEQTTTEQTTTSEKTTTQQSTTSEQTTTQQSTTSEQTTTEQSTTSEQTTTQQSTTSEQTTTQQSTTSEQTTTEQSTTSEQTTTEQSTTTQQSTTSEQTTTEQSTTSEKTTTQESTTSEQTTQESTTSEQTTESSTTEQSTTEKTTENNTEQTTEGTTEGTTEKTTDGTTEESTEGTTEGTTEQSTTESTTESSTESTTDSSTTESNSSDKECPETEDDQYLLVCPTSFKRHPKYCNMFYQCTEDDDTSEAKVAMFKCPNNTIYDESQTQCVEEDKADKKCDGEMANKRRFKRYGLNYKEPIVADKERQSCPSVGYFSFEKRSECSKGFLKCEKTKKGQLRGYVYQCPDGYVYWSISKRCELINNVKDCKRSNNDWTGRWNIPVERKNIAV